MATAVALGGCSGRQSALDPAGFEARMVAELFWWMLAAAALIWIAVMALAWYAARRRGPAWSGRAAARLILVCGAILPTLVLALLLVFGLRMMPPLRAPGEGLRIAVQGEQFWWRVTYELPDGTRIQSANEIRMPRGQRTELMLTAQDVIHSFWIPPLGGKMDMIPGMRNRLVLQPERSGRFRGACAEFCGASHALMALDAQVMEPEAFEAWLEARREPPPPTPDHPGATLFLARGCGACHTVAGTPARGRVGPDLSALSERPSIAAGILPNDVASLDRFIRYPREIKPGARMPGFDTLPEGETALIAAWLSEGSIRR
ncbi:cytochrome c oxidase subunit II [Teichococcus globiformis]|uniref:cytochrome c oxidase subunit II n=1 Tax=Teichococcus globiformis TaxID=2307229 RepID=UPI0036D2967A